MLSLRSHFFRFIAKYIVSPQMNRCSTVDEYRVVFEKFGRLSKPLSDTKTQTIDAGSVPTTHMIVPGTSGDKVLLFLHGGAYNTGSVVTHCGLAVYLSRACGANVFLPDYRLAPEHPFPAALDDIVLVYTWLLEQGYDPRKIAMAGDSSGGGLAIASLVRLRDEGKPIPAAAVCMSPWVDLEGKGETIRTNADSDFCLNIQWISNMAVNYAGENNLGNPLISPLHADLKGLPPLFIQVGTDEILLSDSQRLAERATSAGVDVTLDVWDKMWHVWQTFAPANMPESRNAIKRAGEFICEHFNA